MSFSELSKPRPGDTHPASGFSRGVLHLVMLEMDRLAETFELPPLDDLDEERVMHALAPYLRAVRSAFCEQNQAPLGPELRKIRSGIREFARWRRLPTQEEISEIVYGALGQEKPAIVTGGEAQARSVVSAPPRALLEPTPQSSSSRPTWLEEFAEVVGDNELLAKTAIRPLLNMSDGAARRAILMMRAGKESKRAGDSEHLQQQRASTERRQARTDYVGSLLAEVKAMNRKGEEFGDGSALKADWGMPGFVCMGRFDEGDTDSLSYAPGRVFKPTGIPGRVTGWVPVEEYRAYLIGLGKDGKELLERFDAEHDLQRSGLLPKESMAATAKYSTPNNDNRESP